jgi:L-fucose isomerase-like protein
MKKKKHRAAKSAKIPAFVVRGQHAAARVAKKLKMQNRATGLPLIVWENGKVVEKFF